MMDIIVKLMCDLIRLFKLTLGVNIKSSQKKYKEVFNTLKTYLKSKIITFLDTLKISNKGRKRTIDWDKFFDCLFYITDNGLKMSYLKEKCGICKSTFYHYFSLISNSSFFEQIHAEIVHTYGKLEPDDYLITDTFTVKSMEGSEGVGRNPTDRGRNGIKVSIICDQNLITHAVHLTSANIHDSKILIPTTESSISDLHGKKCLADSGYAGHKYISKIKQITGISLISKPKRTNNLSIMSHQISEKDSILLQRKRNYIERLNGNIRKFRGLMIKYTKKMSSYRTYLFIAILCITCYCLFVL